MIKKNEKFGFHNFDQNHGRIILRFFCKTLKNRYRFKIIISVFSLDLPVICKLW
jgi:hypothetical protein